MFENKERVEKALTMSSKIMTDFACLGTVSEILKVDDDDDITVNGDSWCRCYSNAISVLCLQSLKLPLKSA